MGFAGVPALTVVPEPGTAVSVGTSLAVWLWRRVRRFRQRAT